MPLLDDAKTCYVGTTPITTIMAGSVQVWPKGPPPPFRNVRIWYTRFQGGGGNALCTNASTQDCSNAYMTWDVNPRPSSCVRGYSYSYEYKQKDFPGEPWRTGQIFGTPGWRSYLPDSMPNSMAFMITTAGQTNKRSYTWRLVYNDGINQPVESEIMSFEGTDSELSESYLPLEYQENECNGRP